MIGLRFFIFIIGLYFTCSKVKGWTCSLQIAKVYKRSGLTAQLEFSADIENIEQTRPFNVKFYNDTLLAYIRYNSDGSSTGDAKTGFSITGDSSGKVYFTINEVRQDSAGTYIMEYTGGPTKCSILFILGLPSKPTITQDKTPSLGKSVTLTCSSTSRTIPNNHSLALTYNWRVNNTDNPSSTRYVYSSNRHTITLTNIRKEDASKNFSCTATEDVNGGYTSSRSDLSLLNVHIQVTDVTIYVGSAVAANPFQVFTGESIMLTCRTSISRPEAVIVWYIGSQEKQRSYRNNFTFNPENSYNNKDIYCKAFNIQPESQAVNSTKLTLHVQESTSVRSFHIGQNESTTNATFEEYDKDIELTCVIGGMPASSVDIVFEGVLIKKLSNTNKIAYSFKYITCTDGGDYVCRSIDSFGKSTNKSLSLYVECAPRPVRQILHNITADLGVPVNVSFTAIAYPEPGPKGFHWFKEDRSIWIALLRNEDFKIASAGLETNLTITNVSREHFGKYRLTANNRIGSYNQIFYLSEKENISGSRTCVCTEKSFVTLSIILGVVCTLMMGYSAGLTIMYKRNIKKKDVIFKSRTKSSRDNTTADPRRKEEQDYIDDTANEDSSKQYTELAHYTNAQTTYDRLQT